MGRFSSGLAWLVRKVGGGPQLAVRGSKPQPWLVVSAADNHGLQPLTQQACQACKRASGNPHKDRPLVLIGLNIHERGPCSYEPHSANHLAATLLSRRTSIRAARPSLELHMVFLGQSDDTLSRN